MCKKKESEKDFYFFYNIFYNIFLANYWEEEIGKVFWSSKFLFHLPMTVACNSQSGTDCIPLTIQLAILTDSIHFKSHYFLITNLFLIIIIKSFVLIKMFDQLIHKKMKEKNN